MDSAVPQSAPRSGTVGVYAAQGELRALAARDIGAGEAFFDLQGWVVPEPTRYTIQLGPGSHLEMPAGVPWEIVLRDYPWRFLNHSCVPNTRIVGRQLVALAAIREGTELSFDYDANEWDMAEPFACRCGHCGGRMVRGFVHLSAAEREARRSVVAESLLPYLEGEESQRKMAADPSLAE